MATLARRLSELDLGSERERQAVRTARTTRADIVDFDLFIPEELTAPELPRACEEAVLDLYRAETFGGARLSR